MSYFEAKQHIKERWPNALIEASTCREHLFNYLQDWYSLYKFIIEEDGSKIGAISGGWVDFVTGDGLEDDNYGDRQVVISGAFGVPLRLFLCNPTMEPEDCKVNRIVAASRLRRLVKRSFHVDTTICIENHGGITASPRNVQDILDWATDIIPVYTVLDPINYATCGTNPYTATRILRPECIGLVHVKDIDANGHYTMPGMGLYTREWHRILDYLMESNYKGMFTIEYEGKDLEHRDEYIDKAIEFLMEHIDG